MKKLVLCLFGLMMSTSVLAGAGWSGPRTIVNIETHESGTEIRLEGFGSGCTQLVEGGVTLTWTKIDIAHPNKQQMMAVLMTAFATGKPINVLCRSADQWAPADNIIITR